MNFDCKIIIPVKGTSVRVPNKNALPFGNKQTMLEWKISQLLEIFKPSDIVVSTDCENFKNIAKQYGTMLHQRQDPLLSDEKHQEYKFSNLIFDIIKSLDTQHIAWAPCTSPLMSAIEYKSCFAKYEEMVINGNYDSLLATQLQKEYFWDEQGPINYNTENHVPSQNLPNWHKVTNSLFMVSLKLAKKYKYFLGKNPYKAEVSKLAGFDIDHPQDYEIAKALLPVYLKENNKTL